MGSVTDRDLLSDGEYVLSVQEFGVDFQNLFGNNI